MRYYIFNLIFTSTLARSLWCINSDFSHVGFVSLDAIEKPIGKITLVVKIYIYIYDDHFELSTK
jgi:hypothetical protein